MVTNFADLLIQSHGIRNSTEKFSFMIWHQFLKI